MESPDLLQHLAALDAVICGTDDTTSRAYINQLCHQFFVPVLDLGVQFVADETTGKLVKEVGRVNFMLPGTPCLACSGQIDPSRLQAEGLPPHEREKRTYEGYVRGINITEPSMMVFNMQIAARGVQQLIAWATGLVPPGEDIELFQFLGIVSPPGIRKARKRSWPTCPICSDASTVLGRGDRVRMFTLPRPEYRGM